MLLHPCMGFHSHIQFTDNKTHQLCWDDRETLVIHVPFFVFCCHFATRFEMRTQHIIYTHMEEWNDVCHKIDFIFSANHSHVYYSDPRRFDYKYKLCASIENWFGNVKSGKWLARGFFDIKFQCGCDCECECECGTDA